MIELRRVSIIVLSIAIMGPAPLSFGARSRSPAKKKKTVAQLLSEIDTRGKNTTIKKRIVDLPKAQAPVRSEPLTQVKPPRMDDLTLQGNSDEAQLEALTDRSIKELYNLSRIYAKSPRRGELWLRLAESYVEKSKYIQYRVEKKYDDQLQRFFAKKGPKPKMNLDVSRGFNMKAIKLYEWFLRDYPKDPKDDQALFFLGYNYTEIGDIAKGTSYYQRLTQLYPNSPYVSEANFALGEHYFDNEKWSDAEKAYAQVLKNRRARLYTFALYKIAWCQYRMGRTAEGLKTLEEVVRLSRTPTQESRLEGRRVISRIRLGSEALKDIVLFYSDVGSYKNAYDYFTNIGGEKAVWPMLEKLAYIYSDAGHKQEAEYIFNLLLEHAPTAPKAFDYQYQIVLNYTSSLNQAVYQRELFKWVDGYGPDSAWAQANRANTKLLQDAYTLRESALRNYVLLMHKNAQNSQKKNEFAEADQGYRLYLSKFGNSPRAAEMHFFYGELLYALQRYPEAAREYQASASMDQKGKYYQLALLDTLLSLEKGLKTDDQVKQLEGNSLTPVPFGSVENQFIAAADKYVQAFPHGDKVVDVRFKAARLFYTYNHFDEALTRFREIIRDYPKTLFAVYSANLILDIHNLRKDYSALAQEGTELMHNRALTDQGFQTDVRDIVEKASFKKAQDLESKRDYENSAKAFASFAQNYPQSPLALPATYNAGVNYERAHNLPAAIALYTKVSNSNQKDPTNLKQKSLLLVGRLYEQTAQYSKAAAVYEHYVKENPKDKRNADLYYNAAVIWEGQKQFYKAMNDYEKYYELSRRKDRTLALFKIAQIHEKMDHWKSATDAYETYMNSGANDPDTIVQAQFKIAQLLAKRGKLDESDKAYQKTVAIQKRFSEQGQNVGLVYAAEAKFHHVEKIYQQMVAIRIPHNPKRQAAAIKDKLYLLNLLNRGLSDVIRYDEGNMVIASLTKLGQAYDNLGEAILSAPVPAGLNQQELAAYKKGVAEVAKPLQQKALDNYQAAVAKSYQTNFYNEYTKQALDALAKYMPDKYGVPDEQAIPEAKLDDMGLKP